VAARGEEWLASVNKVLHLRQHSPAEKHSLAHQLAEKDRWIARSVDVYVI